MNKCLIIHTENPTRCNNVSKFYYFIFVWTSTCFGRHTAHYQEPKTALAASGFSYVKYCWTCNWWTLSGPDLTTCFGRHTAHHQEPKNCTGSLWFFISGRLLNLYLVDVVRSGFSYVEGCWAWSWWTLSGQDLTTSTNYTSNNLPHMKNQRLLVQF